MSEERMFPPHGKLSCALCFEHGKQFQQLGKWQMRRDPGSWGSRTPRYLVLGFSKGATQSDIFAKGLFDDVAFGGRETRRNLTSILRRVGLLSTTETVGERIRATEKDFHFGSLARCSLARLDEDKSKVKGRVIYATSGKLMPKSFVEIPQIISQCTQTFLRSLPDSLKTVVVLGVTDAYVRGVRETMRQLHPNGFRVINPIAYENERLVWVHLTHPSKGNGTLNAWLEKRPEQNASARKRELAIEVLRTRGLVQA